MPITYDAANELDEPYNNLSNSEILLQAVEDGEENSIIVCDSHYVDLACMNLVRLHKRMLIT